MNYSGTDGLSFACVSVRYLKSLSEPEKAEVESGSVRADGIIKVKEIYRG